MAKELSRRDFLKGMAAGAMGIAAAGVLGSVPAPAHAEGAKYTPGTYSATAKGIASDVKVTMTFDESMITAVDIDVSGETPDIGGKIGPQMEQAILSKQSADVDIVATATVTSNAPPLSLPISTASARSAAVSGCTPTGAPPARFSRSMSLPAIVLLRTFS